MKVITYLSTFANKISIGGRNFNSVILNSVYASYMYRTPSRPRNYAP